MRTPRTPEPAPDRFGRHGRPGLSVRRGPHAEKPPPPALPPGVDVRTEPYPKMSGRRRLALVLLAVTTALTIAVILLRPLVDPRSIPRPVAAPEAARCVQGQNTDCVGGSVQVIVPPASR